jgi:hypothetical protein
MWIISFMPEWAIHLLFGLGVVITLAGFVLGMIPIIKRYIIPVRVIGLFILVLGLYLEGGLADNKEWQLRVKEMEAKMAQLEVEAAKTNIQVQEKVVEKTKVVREKGQDIIKYVDRWNTKEVIKEVEGPERIRREEVIKYIENCPIPKELVDLHNQAAEINKAAEGKK